MKAELIFFVFSFSTWVQGAALPSVKITLAVEDFEGAFGLEKEPEKSGVDAEKLALVRFSGFEEVESETVSCGIVVHGATSRTQSPKRSYRIKFKKSLGSSHLNAQIFGGEGVSMFDELLLRNPAHDSWTIKQDTWRENARYINEQWCRETMILLGHKVPRLRWVKLFINEDFWGLYLLSELPDEHFMSSTFGGKDQDYFVVRSGEKKFGNSVAYDRFLEILDHPQLQGLAAMNLVERYLKVDQFIDYFLVQVYAVNADWPKKNYALTGVAAGKTAIRFFTWDSETAFFEKWESVRNPERGSALDYDQFSDLEFTSDKRGPGFLFRRLIKIPQFRGRFGKRVRELLRPAGILGPQEAASRYRKLLEFLEPHLKEESQRWGKTWVVGGKRYGPDSEKWERLTGHRSWLFAKFFPQRSQDMLQDLKNHGFLTAE